MLRPSIRTVAFGLAVALPVALWGCQLDLGGILNGLGFKPPAPMPGLLPNVSASMAPDPQVPGATFSVVGQALRSPYPSDVQIGISDDSLSSRTDLWGGIPLGQVPVASDGTFVYNGTLQTRYASGDAVIDLSDPQKAEALKPVIYVVVPDQGGASRIGVMMNLATASAS